MRRIGVLILLAILIPSIFSGCSEDTTAVEATGLQLRFANCLTFTVHAFVDGDYWGRYSSEEPALLEIPAGVHEFYCRSSAVLVENDKYFCWSETVSVEEGRVTPLTLDCTGAFCPPDE